MKIKGGGPRKSAKPAEEPNFYKLPFLPANETTAGQKHQAVSQLRAPEGSQVMNIVLEQALAQHALFNYSYATSRTTAPTTSPLFTPLSCPPPLPSVSRGTSATQAMGYPAPEHDFSIERQPNVLLSATRDNEFVTAALLHRLRRR